MTMIDDTETDAHDGSDADASRAAPSGMQSHAPVLDAAMNAFQALVARNAQVSTLVASTLGIGSTDIRALMFIARSAEVTPKRVAEFLELSTGAVTGLVDRIVAARLVERVPNPNDRRSLLLELAPDGVTAVGRINDFYRRAFEDAIPTDATPLLADAFSAIGDALARTAASDFDRSQGR